MTDSETYLCPQHGAELEAGEKGWVCRGDEWDGHVTALAWRERDHSLVWFSKTEPGAEQVRKESD